METQVMGPVQALREGWELLKRYPVQLLGGFIMFLMLLYTCFKLPLPVVNWVLLLLIAFPLMGGLHVLFLHAARDADPRLVDLLSGFSQFKKWAAAGFTLICGYFLRWVLWIFFLYLVLIVLRESSQPGSLPKLLYAVLWENINIGIVLPCMGSLLVFVLAFAMSIDYAFVLFTAADNTDLENSIARNQELAEGRKLELFLSLLSVVVVCPGILLVIGYIVNQANANAYGLPGWVAYGFGVMTASVLALCAVTSIYVRLDQSTSRSQETQVLPPPPGVVTPTRSNPPRPVFTNLLIAVFFFALLSAIAIPGFVSSMTGSRARTCRENLHRIGEAKDKWAIDNGKIADDTPRMCDLVPKYITSTPSCPSGGAYTVGNMSTYPTCSIGSNEIMDCKYDDHALPHR